MSVPAPFFACGMLWRHCECRDHDRAATPAVVEGAARCVPGVRRSERRGRALAGRVRGLARAGRGLGRLPGAADGRLRRGRGRVPRASGTPDRALPCDAARARRGVRRSSQTASERVGARPVREYPEGSAAPGSRPCACASSCGRPRGTSSCTEAWLPEEWTLERLAGELARRRDAATAAKARGLATE